MYFTLPETENRTLESIELHFSDKSKRITDRKILKHAPAKHADGEEVTAVSTISIPATVNYIGIENGSLSSHDTTVRSVNGTQKSINKGSDNYAFAE